MCACGCFLLAVVAAGLLYCAMHGMWPGVALILVATALLGWFGRKGFGWPPKLP